MQTGVTFTLRWRANHFSFFAHERQQFLAKAPKLPTLPAIKHTPPQYFFGDATQEAGLSCWYLRGIVRKSSG